MSQFARRECPVRVYPNRLSADEIFLLDDYRCGDLLNFDGGVIPHNVRATNGNMVWVWATSKIILIGARFDSCSNEVVLDMRGESFSSAEKMRDYYNEVQRLFAKFARLVIRILPSEPVAALIYGPSCHPVRILSHIEIRRGYGRHQASSMVSIEPTRTVYFIDDDYQNALSELADIYDNHFSIERRFCVITGGMKIDNRMKPAMVNRGVVSGKDGGHRLFEIQRDSDDDSSEDNADYYRGPFLVHKGRAFPWTFDRYQISIPQRIDKGRFFLEFAIRGPYDYQFEIIDAFVRVENIQMRALDIDNSAFDIESCEIHTVPPGKRPYFDGGFLRYFRCDTVTPEMVRMANVVLMDAALGLLGLALPPYVVLWITEWLHRDMDQLPEWRRIRTLEALQKHVIDITQKRRHIEKS